MTVDIEAFPELEPYVAVAFRSKNFEARRRKDESDSELSLRVAAGWLGGVVAAANQAHNYTKVYMYDVNARFDRGFQITSWITAEKLGLPAEPAYYESQNGIDVLALEVRQQRPCDWHICAVDSLADIRRDYRYGWTTERRPGWRDVQSFTASICQWSNWYVNYFHAVVGAALALDSVLLMLANVQHQSGFNMYVSFGCYDMGLWLAFRDAIDLVTPYEDIVMDGVPAPESTFRNVSTDAVVSGMVVGGDGMLIASSTVPHGLPTAFTVVAMGATVSWMLCDLQTNRSMPVSSEGEVAWASTVESGSLLVLGPKTPCHSFIPGL
jgi:hypothetical protein